MLRKIAKTLAAVLIVPVPVGLVMYVATSPQPPAADSSSADWLQDGPYRVASRDYQFVDSSRPTAENRGVPGQPDRSLVTTLWYPENGPAQMPLVIHSHGILSERTELNYAAEALASRGYVVAAANYPLTAEETAGGANINDVVNQPADISFLLDTILALQGEEKPYEGDIDPARIGLTGYSLGGLTTYLATYHPRWREPRVAAAVAIAAPSGPFSPTFFSTTKVPLLVLAGTADALIEYGLNAANVPGRAMQASLVTIAGGTHLGFQRISEPYFRLMDNPDTLACDAVLATLDEDPAESLDSLGSEADGIDAGREVPPFCDYGFPEGINPGRQQMIAEIAILSFFESEFNPESSRREQARTQLVTALAADFREVSYSD